jgi:hypothetical protein
MWYYLLKVLLSAVIIVVVTETAKFNATLGGFIKSLPLISLLAILWLYAETKDVDKIATLSISTLWFVLPTLPFFIVLPILLKQQIGFYSSLFFSILVMAFCYLITTLILKYFGMKL